MKVKKITGLLSALVLSVTALPLSGTVLSAEADSSLSARDPFYSYSKGYNYYESEHFQFIWGNSGDSSKVTSEFLEKNSQNFEACWHVYMDDLKMASPSQSTNMGLRDGKEYKTNIYISGTGLEGMQDDWAYMSYDKDGYAYMFCCVDSMQYNPPSWVFPHEFGHVLTAHQLGWNTNKYSYAWWEALGNWFREQYLYSDYSTDDTGHGTDFFETYMKNLNFTFPCGRDYYASWAFLQYLTENPDNLDGYGKDFVKKMLQEGQVDEYPFEQVERLAPADLKDTLGHYASHMAGLDFEHGDSYRARLDELLKQGDWNWQQIYTMLEPVAGRAGTYKVPTERAPQFAGLNIIPLETTSHSTYTVTLNAETNVNGADWRACVVQQSNDGTCTYSRLFKAGETVEVASQAGKSEYLVVIATPDLDTVTKYGLPGIYDDNSEFSESNVPFSSKTAYPYSVTFSDNVGILKRTVPTESENWWEQTTYSKHSNGGGLVAGTAKVDSSVYVAPDAIVKGSAVVTGNAKILDHAVVEGSATVKDNAVISGYAIVAENAVVSGNARVDDTGLVMGRAEISGNAKVIESACVYGTSKMTDNAVAKGIAFVMNNAVISGQGTVDGDYYDDSGKTVSKGTSYGWTSSQSYSDSRPYTDKLIYAYDFDSDSSNSFSDRYTSTYGVNTGAEWESERTSAKGVLTFDGNDYISLDRSVLYTDDIDIQIGLLDRRTDNEMETLLNLGNSENYIRLQIADNNVIAELKSKGKYETLTAQNAVTDGKWAKLRFILDGDKGKIVVDGQTLAEGEITINPSDIADFVSVDDKEAVYSVGNVGISDHDINVYPFKGSVDFVRVYSSEASAPSETYSETEEISAEKSQVLKGDLNLNEKVDVFDFVKMRKLISGQITDITPVLRASADTNSDGEISVADAVTLQNYILGKISEFPGGNIAEY